MKAKQYLRQIQILDMKIDEKTKERNELYEIAINDRGIGDMNPDKVRSSISLHQTEELIVKYADLEREISTMINQFVNLKHKIIDEIHLLDDAAQIDCLYQRYVQYHTFEQIAVNTGYSIRRVYQIHGDALEAFRKKVKDCI